MLPTSQLHRSGHDLRALPQVRHRRGPAGRRRARASTSTSTAAAHRRAARLRRRRDRKAVDEAGYAVVMSARRARVAAFVALLVAIFALAALAGARARSRRGEARRPAPTHAHARRHAATHGAAHAPARRRAAGRVAHGGLRLVAGAHDASPPAAAARLTLSHRRRRAARRVRDFETEQARRMHLIVVRRDLRRFQHLHPAQAADGAWTTPLTLPDAGVYRAFADFQTGGARHTLGIDLFAAGALRAARAAAAPSDRATSTATTSRCASTRAGELRFAVSRGGAPVDRPAALPRRARPPRHAARGRPRLRARPPARPPRELAFETGDAAARHATACSCSSATRTASTRPPSRAR